ncbi:MAG: bifunctional DNA-formamidopyrimidine glycosylase/DNA-(apurinic or apyrimidinic site) lyase [Anaerolineae bacterium]
MPELPEVETIANDLRSALVGTSFSGVTVHWPNIIAQPAVTELWQRLVGQRITNVRRRGKYVVFELSKGDYLIIHLKMTGQLLVRPAEAEIERYAHTIFDLDDGRQLRFADMRKFGRVYLVADPDSVLGKLGPEPLADDFTLDHFAHLLARRSGRIKPLLLNQQFMAGIGNIYADETLFEARIHPLRQADTLSPVEIHRLYHAMRDVLRGAIRKRGTTFDGYYRDTEGKEGTNQESLRVFRRAGQPCPRCQSTLERTVVGGRGTYFCPRCQT